MNCDNVKSNSELNFTFEGDYEVNALTVARAIEGLVELSTATASHNYPEAEIRLSVCAVKPGSLEIAFIIATAAIQTLLAPGVAEYACNLASTIVSIFEIKGFLKNKAPRNVTKTEDAIIIERQDGCRIMAPKSAGVYFIDQSVDNSVTHIIQNASASPSVSGIKVSGPSNYAIIGREDFEECSKVINIETGPLKEVTYVRKDDVLFIRKPDMIGDSQWGFKTDKNIVADMEDRDFLDKVHNREVLICSGMYLVADLEITTVIGKDGLPEGGPSRYVVRRVSSWGVPESTQTTILE